MPRNLIALFILLSSPIAIAGGGSYRAEDYSRSTRVSEERLSRVPAPVRKLVNHWAESYRLDEKDIDEQLVATHEAIQRRLVEKRDVPESGYSFHYKVLGVPEGSKRKAVIIRSNQPAPENLAEITSAAAVHGIKPNEIVVVNLRYETDDVNGMFVKAAADYSDPEIRAMSGIRSEKLNLVDHSIPSSMAQVLRVLELAQDPKTKLMVVHCKAGKARTGTMVACIRIALDGWSVEQALDEGRAKGLRRPLQIKFIEEFAKKWKRGDLKLSTTI